MGYNDPLDIDETTLSLFVYDEDAKVWVKLTPGLEWVNEAGVDTTDVDMYGEPYAGFLWANVTHLSLFSAGGRMFTDIVTTAVAGPDQEVMEGEVVTFDGTDSEGIGGVVNYKWTFYYNWETVTLYGPDPTFTFMKEGGYEAGGSLLGYTTAHARFAPSVEELIVGKAHELVKKARTPASQ